MWIVNDGNDYLAHHGILGQKWGIRRYQYEDGTLTPEGRKRYGLSEGKSLSRGDKKTLLKMSNRVGLGDDYINALHTVVELSGDKAKARLEADKKAYIKAHQDTVDEFVKSKWLIKEMKSWGTIIDPIMDMEGDYLDYLYSRYTKHNDTKNVHKLGETKKQYFNSVKTVMTNALGDYATKKAGHYNIPLDAELAQIYFDDTTYSTNFEYLDDVYRTAAYETYEKSQKR